MAIVEADQDRVVAHGLHRRDAHLALAGLERFLARAMALDLGGGRIHAQQLERQAPRAAIVEADFQHARLRMHGQRGGMGGVFL
ncbi:hypothetical protein D3C85_1348480 [compost metagenome]